MDYYYKPCKEHEKEARYCPEEKRWICEDCEPEIMGYCIEKEGKCMMVKEPILVGKKWK